MKVCFFASDKDREQQLANDFLSGALHHGCQIEWRSLAPDVDLTGFDIGCFVGVKSRALHRRFVDAQIPFIMFDKGYCRHKRRDGVKGWEFWRIAVNAHQPTARLAALNMPGDRLDALELEITEWRESGQQIVIAGSSAKYHDFYDLRNPTSYASGIVKQLRDVTQRPIVYRPKPSWREAVPISRTRFSRPPETITSVLAGAHALVTHGSNACFEAVLAGVPCFILGDAVAKPISSTDIGMIERPMLATFKQRRRWLRNIAYFQWTSAEFEAGDAWDFIRGELHDQ